MQSNNRIVGFSTVATPDNGDLKSQSKSQSQLVDSFYIFSGDTVVEKQFWGHAGLQVAFGVLLCSIKIRNPRKKVQWLLITKGYKTYLLLANNFSENYPNSRKTTPYELQTAMDGIYSKLYPNRYNAVTGIIRNTSDYKLKVAVAPLSDLVGPSKEKVDFFLEKP